MATIDDKVVAMSFEAGKFEAGVNQAIAALEKLKGSLKLPASSKGLDDVAAAAKRIDLSHIGRGVDAISQKLGYFSVASIAIFTNVAMKAAQAGAQIAKSLTIEPVLAGYKEYATKLNSVQTILANTQAAGTSLKDVNATLQELNEYSDKTIYNFGEMARNIGTFTAAGVDLKTATGAIKGIANLAALSGSNSQQASTAMYQLSQAIAAGRVSLMDWNSVVNAGMGGTVFQRALAQTAETMGTLKEGSVKLVGPMKNVSIAGKSFRESIGGQGPKWLTSDVLTKTLKQFTGDMTDAELAAMGFNEQQIKAIQLTGKTAMFAATEVKTLTQVLDVAKETAGSGWAETWQIIFGDFGEAKKTFTALSNTINGFINKNAEARNKVLADWKALGGRTVLIEAIGTMFNNLGKILKPIKQAFRDIFPAKTGQDLLNLTWVFQDFAEALKPSAKTVENLRRTFKGVFAALDIGKQIVSGIFTVFKELFGALGGGEGGFLSLTASIGDWIVSLDKALKKGDGLKNFFEGLGKILAAPVEMLSKFAGAVGDVLSALGTGGVTTGLNGMTKAATPLQAVLEGLSNAWDRFSNSIKNSVDMSSILESIGTAISGIGVAIGNAASSMNFQAILQVIRTGLFAALVLMFKQFLGKGSFLSQISTGFSKGILANVSGMFDGLNGSMKAMQNNIKAKTLKEIAIAIALLAASVLMLSFVNPERLNASLGAMTIMFGELIGAMALLDKIAKTGGFLKLPIIIAGLIGLAIAIDLLTISVLALSRLSWDELLRGLAGVGGLLAGVAAAVKPLSASSGGLIRAGLGITALAVGLRILASAVATFAQLSWEEMVRGLAGVGGGLFIIGAAMKVMPLSMVVTGAGLIVVATGLKILAGAVAQFGAIDWRTMGRGLAGIAGSLIAIGVAMRLMPKTLIITAAGLAIVALSLGKISDAVIKMGGMSIAQIAKGIGTLAGSLLVLAAALHAMTGTLAGAAALAVAATGIALLAPAIAMLGKQSWSQILKGMVTLAGALTILGVAGLALGPVVPALLGLGAAMVLLGGGLALAGAGVLLFSTGLSALMVAGPAAVGILVAAINEFLLAVPKLATSFALALLAVVDAFAKTAPQFVAAMVKIVNSLLDVIIKSSPKLAEAITALLGVILRVLAENQDEIIAAGFALLIALLQGIKDNINEVTTMVVDIVVTFLRTLAANITRIVAAGVNLLVQFLKGIANNLALVVTAVANIITRFIQALTTNWVKIITAGGNLVVKLIEGITKNLSKIVAAGANAIISFVTGLSKNAKRVVDAGVDAVLTFIAGLGKNAVKLAEGAAKVIVQFLDGLTAAINKYAPQIQESSKRLGWAIINGMTWGLAGKAKTVYDKASEIANKVVGIFKKIPLINSPSKATKEVGESLMEGLTLGMDSTATTAYSSAEAISRNLINVFKTIFQTNSPSKVLQEIGLWVGQGFAKGLRGSGADISSAFAELNGKLTEAMKTARETIISEEKKLAQLRAAEKPDAEAIAKAQKILNENKAILKRSLSAREALNSSLQFEKRRLTDLTKEYDTITTKMQRVQEKLGQLKADRDSLKQSLTDQYSASPGLSDLTPEQIASGREQVVSAQAELDKLLASGESNKDKLAKVQGDVVAAQAEFDKLIGQNVLNAEGTGVDLLATYMNSLKIQTDSVIAYQATLQQLRKLGLDDVTYQKLLQEGPADAAFANQLLAGGKTAVTALNTLDTQLMKVSKSLAIQAARNLKQAGIDAAQGLLDGLQSRNAKIKKAMEDLVDDIVAAIRSRLDSHSPSRVFEKIGSDTMQGLANGFTKSSKMITRSVVDAADNAISSMKSSISKMTDILAGELNTNPVITPVLDLSLIKNQRGALSALTNVTPITAAASYGQASIISSEQVAAQMEEMNAVASSGPMVKFEQNNFSPKALTEIEIYRQTRNQLSQIKSALAVT